MYDQDPNQFSGNYVDENTKDFFGVHYGNLKHIVRYVGGAAWHILEFFVARNLNTARPLATSEINWTKMQPGR